MADRRNRNVRLHSCSVNTQGQVSMEAIGALELSEEVFAKYNGRFYIKELVSDDDSTMRSLLKHEDNHDKGKLKKTYISTNISS